MHKTFPHTMYPTENGVYAVLVSRHPPEESAASRAEGGAIVSLLRELLRQLHSLTLEEGGGMNTQ